MIEVADQGIGIAPEILPRVFNAFEQADTSLTRKFGGLGLGLTICKALIEGHGGTISVQSDGQDQGTTIRIELPVVPEPVSPPIPIRAPVTVGRGKSLRILVVEDHEETRNVIVRLLAQLGHRVNSAATLREAIDVARSERFQLIVSDIGLPDGSGRDLLRKLGPNHGVKAIALSGFGTDDDIRKSLESGFTEHLVKPIDVQTLEAAIVRSIS
jgi:two-component system, chemotaxis family, CheB/CheR fusion protein